MKQELQCSNKATDDVINAWKSKQKLQRFLIQPKHASKPKGLLDKETVKEMIDVIVNNFWIVR